MALNDRKITDAEIAACGVQSQPNKLTGSAVQNKKAFDKLVDEVVKVKFNALIDELKDTSAAGELGASVTGLNAVTVAGALAELLEALQGITQGSVAPGSIGSDELAGGAVTPAKLSGILPEHVGVKYGTAVPTAATLGEGEIYLLIEEA